ncbi:MAG: hypothetical protein K9L69_00215 [Candidatus Omnitrophica bacterium]|nr:hypothetical protein [Candidatus Omnitrophota bacterium]MCF7894553.1 hypothetical protein [Candidatus Omnitrophota bacterium]
MNNGIYQDFVKKFKVALTNCSIYFPQHPIFFQSVNNFKKSINLVAQDELFLLIKVKPKALIINGKNLEEVSLYKDLATFFHRRKVKSIKIEKEITAEELSKFLVNISSSEKNILAKGGIKKILKENEVKNIEIDELDYSQLIKGEGKGVKDIWSYILRSEDTQGNNKVTADKFADKFRKITEKYGVKEILEDKRMFKQLLDLVEKIEDKDNFKKIIESLVRSILDDESLDKITNKEQFKSLFFKVDLQDLANLLSKFLQSDKRFNPASFRLFSTLISPDAHKVVAGSLNREIKAGKSKFDIDKIRNLFESLDDQSIVPIYQKNLSLDNLDSVSKREFSFDYNHLHQNYRLLLLDLFFYETSEFRLVLILKKILLEIERNFLDNIEFVNKFAKIYIKKTIDTRSKELNSTIKKVWSQSEKNIFKTDDFKNFIFLTKVLKTTTLDVYFYLDEIEEKKFNPLVLKLFFKFFPKQIDKLYKKIKDKRKDYDFLKKIITDLKLSNHFAALDLLKRLFNLVPILVKIEILDIIKNYPQCDQNFILSLVNSQSFHIRKKSVEMAVKFPQLHKQTAQKLLSLSNYFGFNSKIILENLEIINQNYIPQARPFLDKLTRRGFFWDRQIRKKAKQVLENHLENR